MSLYAFVEYKSI